MNVVGLYMQLTACSFLAMALFVSSVQADEWALLPGKTSASFAQAEGWLPQGTAGLSWPDGRQALLTYWQRCYDEKPESCFTQRCIDYFDSDMRLTGSVCYSAY